MLLQRIGNLRRYSSAGRPRRFTCREVLFHALGYVVISGVGFVGPVTCKWLDTEFGWISGVTQPVHCSLFWGGRGRKTRVNVFPYLEYNIIMYKQPIPSTHSHISPYKPSRSAILIMPLCNIQNLHTPQGHILSLPHRQRYFNLLLLIFLQVTVSIIIAVVVIIIIIGILQTPRNRNWDLIASPRNGNLKNESPFEASVFSLFHRTDVGRCLIWPTISPQCEDFRSTPPLEKLVVRFIHQHQFVRLHFWTSRGWSILSRSLLSRWVHLDSCSTDCLEFTMWVESDFEEACWTADMSDTLKSLGGNYLFSWLAENMWLSSHRSWITNAWTKSSLLTSWLLQRETQDQVIWSLAPTRYYWYCSWNWIWDDLWRGALCKLVSNSLLQVSWLREGTSLRMITMTIAVGNNRPRVAARMNKATNTTQHWMMIPKSISCYNPNITSILV